MECVYKRLVIICSKHLLLFAFPKDTQPLDKDRILGIAKSSGLENPDFTSAVNYLRGEGAQSIPLDIKKIMEDSNLWVNRDDTAT
jgi:hypothetical protein